MIKKSLLYIVILFVALFALFGYANTILAADFTVGPPSWASDGPQDIPSVISNVTNWVLGIAGTVAVLFIIIGGVRYITSAGNQKLQENAKKTLTEAIIGLAIIILSFVIVRIVFAALGA